MLCFTYPSLDELWSFFWYCSGVHLQGFICVPLILWCMGHTCFMYTLMDWLTDSNSWGQCVTFPSTAAAWGAIVWTLSLVTSALLVCLPVCQLCPSRSTTRPMWSPAPKSLYPLLLWYNVCLPCCLHVCTRAYTFGGTCPDYACCWMAFVMLSLVTVLLHKAYRKNNRCL